MQFPSQKKPHGMQIPYECEVATLIKWANSRFDVDAPEIRTIANMMRRISQDDQLRSAASHMRTRIKSADIQRSSQRSKALME